jgi:hypothetical protein
VRLPQSPQESSASIDTVVGSLPERSFQVGVSGALTDYFINRLQSGPIAYTVSYVDFGVGLTSLSGSAMLDAKRAQIQRDIGSVLQGAVAIANRTEVSLGPYKGEEFSIDAGRERAWRIRLYSVDHRCYALWAFGSRKQVWSPQAAEFFASFALIK